MELRHTGGMRRSGLTAAVLQGDGRAQRVAEALGADRGLAEAALPLDFTRFEIHGESSGCWSRVELVGASHVAIALPPIRSYVRLYPDQREALVAALTEVDRVLDRIGPASTEAE